MNIRAHWENMPLAYLVLWRIFIPITTIHKAMLSKGKGVTMVNDSHFNISKWISLINRCHHRFPCTFSRRVVVNESEIIALNKATDSWQQSRHTRHPFYDSIFLNANIRRYGHKFNTPCAYCCPNCGQNTIACSRVTMQLVMALTIQQIATNTRNPLMIVQTKWETMFSRLNSETNTRPILQHAQIFLSSMVVWFHW